MNYSTVFPLARHSALPAVPLWSVVGPVRRGIAPVYAEAPTGAIAFNQKCVRPNRTVMMELGRSMERPGERGRERARICEGDIMVNSTGRGTLGRVGLVSELPPDNEVYADGHVALIRPNPKSIRAQYLWYLLSTEVFYRYANEALSVGSTNQMELPSSSIAHLQIPLPDDGEQVRIVRMLDQECGRIDEIIREQDFAKELLDERFAANRASRVLCGFNPITGDGVIPAGWQPASLGAVARLQRGFDLPTESREAGDIPVVSSGGISGRHSTAMCRPPGVVTGRYGTIGRVFYIETEYWPLNTTLFVSDFRGNHPRWLFHLLAALPLAADSAKSAVTGINRNVIGQLRVLRPPLDQQIAIAADLDAESSEIEKIQAALTNQGDLLTERKHALITKAVMGNRDAL